VPDEAFRTWVIASERDTPPEALAVLDEAERERAARFVHAADRAAFATAHAALRCLLGAAIDARPGDIELSVNSSGKPELSPKHARSRIEFSISHTAGFAAIALSRGGAIGIDIERRRRVDEHVRIASRLFDAAVAKQLATYRDEACHDIFLQLWTAAEAYTKATGLGLAGAGWQLPFALASDGTPVLLEAPRETGTWSLLTLALPVDCFGSVVVAGAIAPRSCVPEVTTLARLAVIPAAAHCGFGLD